MGKVSVNNYSGLSEQQFEAIKRLFINLKGTIKMTFDELKVQLDAMTAQNEKAHQEHVAKLAELEAAIAAAGQTTPEVDAALAALKASIQRDDDMNPDATPADPAPVDPAPET